MYSEEIETSIFPRVAGQGCYTPTLIGTFFEQSGLSFLSNLCLHCRGIWNSGMVVVAFIGTIIMVH